MTSPVTLEQIRRIKDKYEISLLKRRNVLGVGIGFKEQNGRLTDEMALIVSVFQKLPAAEIGSDDFIPTELEGVPVDVKEVGEIRALG